jgi:hypothetical protein
VRRARAIRSELASSELASQRWLDHPRSANEGAGAIGTAALVMSFHFPCGSRMLSRFRPRRERTMRGIGWSAISTMPARWSGSRLASSRPSPIQPRTPICVPSWNGTEW